MAAPTLHPVASAMHDISDDLKLLFYERSPAIESAILALLTSEHWYALGPPGTGKSELVRALVERIEFDPGVTGSFEVALSRLRPPEAVLGPQDMDAFKKSIYRRHIKGYLQDAVIVFIDEIGKMNPAVGNEMLASLNERLGHTVDPNTGRSTFDIPLHTAFTASNELIVNESDEGAALWDRLLFRCVVDYIQEKANLMRLLTRDVSAITLTGTTVKYTDLLDVTRNVIPQITLTQETAEQVALLVANMTEADMKVSTRRWFKCTNILRASAFLDGRSQTEPDDIQALRFALWENPAQIEPVERMCLAVSNPSNEALLKIKETIATIEQGIADREGKAMNEKAEFGVEANTKLKKITAELEKMAEKARTEGKSTVKIDQVIAYKKQVHVDIFVKCLEMDEAKAKAGV